MNLLILAIIINGILFPVVQQPDENMLFVSSVKNEFTEYTLSDEFNTPILFAHNYLAGKYLYNISVNDEVGIVFIDHTDIYKITVRNYEHNYKDLDIIQKYYLLEKLVLQTCYKKGLLFLLGEYEYTK